MPLYPATAFNTAAKLIGTYLNLILYGVELVAIVIYFTSARAKRDKRFIAIAVITNLIIDTITTFAQCVDIFKLLIIEWGRSIESIHIHWSIAVWVFGTGFGSFVVEVFMALRYYRLTSNWFVTTVIGLLILLSLSGSLYLGINVANSTHIPPTQLNDKKPVTIALASTVATDICITAALAWKLLYQERSLSLHTKHLIRRIAAFSIMTGTVTCAVALTALITFLISPVAGVSPCFGFIIGRVYTLTMLFTLLFRDKIAGRGSMYVDYDDDFRPSTTSGVGGVGAHSTSVAPSMSTHRTGMVFAVPPLESPQGSLRRVKFETHRFRPWKTKEQSSSSQNTISSESYNMSNINRLERNFSA
ncbi:hypothetical protein BDN70DRAFT_664028 [Pholiota conissans]|uniref:DUF6534 domain-containing protein n=1 Tax=Pholiota conissans TaxID=109636 RepID=A0A9P5Z1P7_9AGAR|nr:hypothetical protein BDN70DRAFT_664028 [Pholiota conissans]